MPLEHHAQDAVDAEPGVLEAGVCDVRFPLRPEVGEGVPHAALIYLSRFRNSRWFDQNLVDVCHLVG